MKLQTVKIKNDNSEDGYSIINASDFVEKEHVRFEEKKEASKKPQQKKVAIKKA